MTHNRAASLALLVSLTLTLIAWRWTVRGADAKETALFDRQAAYFCVEIEDHFEECEQVIQAGRGLFAASRSVERGEWRAFIPGLKMDARAQSIGAMSFVACVPIARKAEFLRETRADGAPDFSIRPEGERDEYDVATYEESFPPNAPSLGFDLRSLPEPRDAFDRARDTGMLITSQPYADPIDPTGRSRLSLCVPIYANGSPHGTIEERRASLQGWVCGWFYPQDLLREVAHHVRGNLDAEVFVGASLSEQGRLCQTSRHSVLPGEEEDPGRAAVCPLDFSTLPLTVRFTRNESFPTDRLTPWVVLGIGLAISALLTMVVWSQARTRTRAMALAKDMTKTLRDREETLSDMNRRLQAAMADLQAIHGEAIQQERLRAIGTMASGIAHDFNNSLAPILGFSEMLLLQPGALDDRERVVRSLELIRMAAKDAAGVVSRLREFYRVRDEADVMYPVEINPLVEKAISLTRPRWRDMAQATGVDMRVLTELGEDLPTFPGNESELREALINLIMNAADAMPKGGTITIRTRSDGTRIVVEVDDVGEGMSEEVRKRCLEPFFTTKGRKC